MSEKITGCKFSVDKDAFKKFLETCSMKGVIRFSDATKITKPLFNGFLIDVYKKDNVLKVLAIDTVRKKTLIKGTLSGVNVIEDGVMPITDAEVIIKCLFRRKKLIHQFFRK